MLHVDVAVKIQRVAEVGLELLQGRFTGDLYIDRFMFVMEPYRESRPFRLRISA